jgi:hypothetical protein
MLIYVVTHRPDDGGSKDSETLVNFYQITRRYNPEDSYLRTHCRENLKSYLQRVSITKISWLMLFK